MNINHSRQSITEGAVGVLVHIPPKPGSAPQEGQLSLQSLYAVSAVFRRLAMTPFNKSLVLMNTHYVFFARTSSCKGTVHILQAFQCVFY